MVDTVSGLSLDIGRSFGIEKSGLCRGKAKHEGVELPSGNTIKSLSCNNKYKYLEMLKSSVIDHNS